MALDRDLQSKLAALAFDTIFTPKNGVTAYGNIIDTKLTCGSFRNIFASFEINQVIGTDIFRIIAQESADGVTWVNASYKLLPSRHAFNTGQVMIDPVPPYLQTVGLMSSARYVRFGIQQVASAGTMVAYVNVEMESENQDFLDYDPTLPVVPPDALP